MKHDEETIKAAKEYKSHLGLNCLNTAFLAGDEHGAARKQKEVDELVDALMHLVWSQNGPPIPTEQEYWEESMRIANELIKKHQP